MSKKIIITVTTADRKTSPDSKSVMVVIAI